MAVRHADIDSYRVPAQQKIGHLLGSVLRDANSLGEIVSGTSGDNSHPTRFPTLQNLACDF